MPGAPYHNHFCPSTKLVEKRREGARQVKRYDAPKTPYQRLLQSDALKSKARAAFQEQHAAINPFVLKRQIAAGSKKIQRLVRAGKCSRGLRYARPLKWPFDSAISPSLNDSPLCSPTLSGFRVDVARLPPESA